VRGGRDGRAMRIGDELARIGIHGPSRAPCATWATRLW
jgi:hypothetical protein